MGKTFFSSDTHLNHRNIIKYCNRPFSSVEEMDSIIIENINKIVNVNDTLYHLGDFCFGDKKNYYEIAKSYRDRIKCKNLILIWGNHDNKIIEDLFSETYDLTMIYKHNQKIVLCHYAMAIWNCSHHGSWHLYGHSHSGSESMLNEKFPKRKSIDVGVDNAFKLLGEFRPFSFNEIRDIMDQKDNTEIRQCSF